MNLNYSPDTGALTGVTLDDGRHVPKDTANQDWLAFLAANPTVSLADNPPPTAVAITAAQRLRADALLSTAGAGEKLTRAIVLVTLDQVNVLLDFDAQLKAAVAAAVSLADLKTRVAAITTNTNPRTNAQLLSAVQSKIDAGDAD